MNRLFSNGPIFMAGRSTADSVGVANDRIVAIGSTEDVSVALGRDHLDVDLGGRMLVPGFQDAHVHPDSGGLMRMRCDLSTAGDLGEALDLIRRYADDHPELDWILGGGWKYGWFPGGNPSKDLLDAITDRPVYLKVVDDHSGWVNTQALSRAGIVGTTPNPSDGVIVRLSDGEAQGTVHEGAMALVERVIPETTRDELESAILEGQRYLLSLGITAWQDAWVTKAVDRAYRNLDEGGRLVARVRGALWWERGRGIEQLSELIDRSLISTPHYFPRSIKLMLDGVCENHTARMLEPYLDPSGGPSENCGMDFIDPAELREIVTAIDAAGLQCHFHALGDAAVRNALDAIQHARELNGPSSNRPHLAHLQLIHPSDIPRFAELGATANIQALWAVANTALTELTNPFLGDERTQLQYPFAGLRDAGARIAMGSDWSVSTPDVMQQIAVAVGRNSPRSGIDEPFLPEQRLRVEDALSGFTSGSAYVNFFDDDSGTIAVGNRADLAILSGDPFKTDHLYELKVDTTIVAGEIVYQRPGTS